MSIAVHHCPVQVNTVEYNSVYIAIHCILEQSKLALSFSPLHCNDCTELLWLSLTLLGVIDKPHFDRFTLLQFTFLYFTILYFSLLYCSSRLKSPPTYTGKTKHHGQQTCLFYHHTNTISDQPEISHFYCSQRENRISQRKP